MFRDLSGIVRVMFRERDLTATIHHYFANYANYARHAYHEGNGDQAGSAWGNFDKNALFALAMFCGAQPLNE